MKKYIAFLLCLIILISLISCDTANTSEDTENDTVNTESSEKNDATTDTSTNDTNKQYYKIENIELTKVRYYIYDSNGNVVLSDETDRPLDISMLGDNIVDIRIGMGTGISIHKYYDVQNNRFSEEYSYVAASSGNLVAYIDTSMKDPMTNRVLVVRDIFDKNVFYKSFKLDFSPTVHDPIESATFTDGEAELKLVYLSERSPVSQFITLPIRRASNEGEILSQAEIAMEMYEAAINDDICVVDESFCEVKLKDCRFPSDNLRLAECEILNKAILDMDGDGINEYIIQSETKDHIVLHYYNGKVYSYCFDSRDFYNLNTDGSFYWIDSYESTNCTRGYNRIAFDGSSLSIKEIYRIKQTSPYDYGDDDHEYYVGGKQITREEFRDYYNSNCRNKRLTIFSPLDISCEYPISSEKAVELASDYWEIKSGTEDGAAGTVYMLKIVILEKPNSDTQGYRIGWQEEGYTSHVIDSCYAQPPRNVRIHKELFVDAITGECREYTDTESDDKGYTEADIAMEMYEETLSDLAYYPTPYSGIPLCECENLGYAYVDLDGDSVNEFVIDCGDTLILRYYEGKVHIYEFTFRSLYYLKTDGSYYWNHTGLDFEYGEKQIYFEGSSLKTKELCRIVNDGESNAEYYLEGKQVTQEEILKYFEDNSKTSIEFAPLEVSWQNKISRSDAIELAEIYWESLDIVENGYRVAIGYNQSAPASVYVVILQRYVIDYYSTLDEIWIDKSTGEAIIPYDTDDKG